MPIALVLRTTKGSALTHAEADANFSNIKAYAEALSTQMSLRLEANGDIKGGAIYTAGQILDSVITPAKLLAQGGVADANKTLKVDAEGKFQLVAPASGPKVFTAGNSDVVVSTGVKTPTTPLTISTITIDGVPAGDIHVVATICAVKVAGSNGGTVTLYAGNVEVGNAPTHAVDYGSAMTMFTIHGKISQFSGGTLSLAFKFETGEVTSAINFGAGSDDRFGRKVTIIAGL